MAPGIKATKDVNLGKRKRDTKDQANPVKKAAINGSKNSLQGNEAKSSKTSTAATIGGSTNGAAKSNTTSGDLHLQIVTGSYERVLHGLSARIPNSQLEQKSSNSNSQDQTSSKNGIASDEEEKVVFSDSFLFAAHASAIRCLAISPETEEASKRYLATGSSDERINVYSLSTAPPSTKSNPSLPSLTGTITSENPLNRSLGSLIHHDRAITALSFPTKAKLFSSAEDATIAISRTRDWTVLSSIKAPIPKPQGRPSGDTAGPGEIPAGVNDFAIHPSQKLMLSVGRGERCMRLWNLMTGKKAGVLNFDRELLTQVGEGKYASGEGRKVLWDAAGENFIVGFERGAAVFGMDSKPKAVIKPTPSTKIHQIRILQDTLAISTEDGRILFYSLSSTSDAELSQLPCLAQLGGRAAGISGRIKDFEIVKSPIAGQWIVVTASSDGAVRIWTVLETNISSAEKQGSPVQVGNLIATHETGNRITCLGAFVLDGKPGKAPIEPEELAGAEEEEEDSDDDE